MGTAAPRRVAITGVGVVASCGIGVDAFWAGLLRPQPDGERRVVGFDPLDHYPNIKEARRADRFCQLAVAAAEEALAGAGGVAALEADPGRIGVLLGTGVGGIATLEEQILTFHEKGPRRVSPFLVPMMMSNAASAALSMRHGFCGPCETTVTACAAGTHAIGNAASLVASGVCDIVVTGGSEAAMTPVGIQGFTNMTALSTSGVSRPFDAARDGFVITEGAAILVLEDLDAALARGAEVLAEVVGWGSTADAHHLTAPSPGGAGAIACMQRALSVAGLEPDQIVQVNAHGTSTPLNDAAEAEALTKVFGTPGPAVTSTKGVTGHALGAAGAIEAVAVVLSMRHGLIPPTAGTAAVDPELPAIDLVLGDARPWVPGPAMSNSFGFGGHNGSLILRPPS